MGCRVSYSFSNSLYTNRVKPVFVNITFVWLPLYLQKMIFNNFIVTETFSLPLFRKKHFNVAVEMFVSRNNENCIQ
jgi:hypothetical protein